MAGTSDGVILYPVPLEALERWWPIILPFAEQMASRFPDDWPVNETLRQARGDYLKIWVALDPDTRRIWAAAGTKILIKASGKRVLAIRWLAGKQRHRWLHLLQELENYGRFNGCTEILIEPGSRAGWQKVLPGYRERPTIQLTKSL